MIPIEELTRNIKVRAFKSGFSLVGVTTPDPPTRFSVYETWLSEGRHGEMGYLGTSRARRRRADPRLILPECKSILVLGVSYPPQRAASPPGPPLTGRVASYAWGDDYHEVIPERLEAMVNAIENMAGHAIPSRWYTDTGPILEREMGMRAGLGWIGKNTCLIHPRMGSFFFLSEILLGIELLPDPPFKTDHCGSCTRCIDACPTGCILDDRTLDARRCLSYLTIELKGAIPGDLRPFIDSWVFGCDTCQEVCPWNMRFGIHAGDRAFQPRENRSRPDLLEEILLTRDDFNRKFQKSPLKRTKWRGYLRNVATALGNIGKPEALPGLAQALQQPEVLIRIHAAWALGKIGDQRGEKALVQALERETNEDVRGAIQDALSQIASNAPDNVQTEGDGK